MDVAPPLRRGPFSACRRLAGATHGSSVAPHRWVRRVRWVGGAAARPSVARHMAGLDLDPPGWPARGAAPSQPSTRGEMDLVGPDPTRVRPSPSSRRPPPSPPLKCSAPNRTRARHPPPPSSSSSCSGRRSAGVVAHFPPPSSPPQHPRPAAERPCAPSPNPSFTAAAPHATTAPHRARALPWGWRCRPPPLPYGGVPPRWNALVRCHFAVQSSDW